VQYRRATIKVHLHRPSKRWRFTCGKQKARSGQLRQKDFYFTGTKESALVQAQKIAAEWNYLAENWQKLYQPTLELLDEPFATVPHWTPKMGVTVPEAQRVAFQNRPATQQEMSESQENVTLQGVCSLYLLWLKTKLDRGDIQEPTWREATGRIKSALAHYPNQQLSTLTSVQMFDAKQALIATLPSRRTARNYALAVKSMLSWFYGSAYGGMHERIDSFNECFHVARANTSNIRTYTLAELTALFKKITEPRLKLCILLGLNCGMYQADIAALDSSEIEDDGIFWDRQKEPDNPFKLYHKMWKPTRRLMKDLWGWKVNSDTISWWLAEYNRKHGTDFQFKNFRKTTNDLLVKHIGSKMVSGSTGELVAVEELSNHFLGQRTDLLVRLYRTTGKTTYKRMNFYLAQLGEQIQNSLPI